MAGIWHHVGLSFENYEASKGEFVEALKPLGIRITLDMAEESACSMDLRDDSYEFWLSKAKPGGGSKGVHVAFNAASAEEVKAFYDASLKVGFKCNGPPGPRPQYGQGVFAAFVKDKDDNNIEAIYSPQPLTGTIHHVGLLVNDYETFRSHSEAFLKPLGVGVTKDFPQYNLCGLTREDGHVFWFWQAPPGQNASQAASLGFNAQSKTEVQDSFNAAVEAGLKGLKSPIAHPERSEQYFTASILDTAGHNIHFTYDPKP